MSQFSIPESKVHQSVARVRDEHAQAYAQGQRPDGSPDNNDRTEIGPTALAFKEWADAGLTAPNLTRMREFRLQRIVSELQRRDYAGVLVFDPLNIRYATDSSNMQLWITHNMARACYIAADGHMVLWDFHGCDHLSAYLPLVKEVRHGADFFYFDAGDKAADKAARFAEEFKQLVQEHGGDNRRVAVDKIEIAGLRALDAVGIEVQDGQQMMEHTRVIKGADEINAMRCAIHTCEVAMAKMEQEMRPGMSEVELWSHLHAENIKRGGEWIETRILSSGPRTNPWMKEAGPRILQNNELLAFDTDLIGPYGMCADLSRTWFCGDGEPSNEQKRLYRIAHDQIISNRSILEPGMGFEDITRRGKPLPEEFVAQRYGVMMHGVGLCDEFPAIMYPQDFVPGAFDYELQPGMMLCVEAYIGSVGGKDGVKLENQVLITEDGFEDMTSYPFDARLLGES